MNGHSISGSNAATHAIAIDPTQFIGSVKPVNGVGQPPMTGALRDWPMLRYLTEAGIPFSRLHDTGGRLGGGVFVDIPNLFPDFSADETNPANWRFAFTDSLVNALVSAGVEPFFRLGVTIENWAALPGCFPPLRTFPPEDFAKWARICEHVVRHYTKGWADGFRHSISHWEIWNEPDSRETPEENEMWRGSFADYCRLYEIVSKHLKDAFPDIKIGGYAGCGVGMAFWKDFSTRGAYHLKCFHDFLSFVREHGCPLDFFSFHSYSKLEELPQEIGYVREHLDKAGFADVEACLDEWLPEPSHDKLGTALQATEIAAALIAFQNGPLDSAAIYDARCGLGDYSPLFNPLTYQPHKAYYAFMAFNELRKLGNAVKVDGWAHAAAALGVDGALAVMLANPGNIPVAFSIRVATRPEISPCRCRIVDENRSWEDTFLPPAMPPQSFLLVEF